MHILINGSQKIDNSNSLTFLKYISKSLDNYKLFSLKDDDYLDIIDSINESDNIVFAFPLYVDSPNTITLSFLDYIIDHNIEINQNVYVIINCGFLEGEHNLTALNIIKNWCLKVGANYSGCVLIGAGEVAGQKKYKWLSKKIFTNLRRLGEAINNNYVTEDIISRVGLLNTKLYCLIANMSWNKKGYKNGLSIDEIRQE